MVCLEMNSGSQPAHAKLLSLVRRLLDIAHLCERHRRLNSIISNSTTVQVLRDGIVQSYNTPKQEVWVELAYELVRLIERAALRVRSRANLGSACKDVVVL